MRDKNLTLEQFNIQLERYIKASITNEEKYRRKPVFATPILQNYENGWRVKIVYPRNFRLLRSLSIAQWYFPEEHHWRILLDLKDLSLSQLNEKQKIEINLLLSSKENCEKYLYRTKRYTSNEIFGNILGNDLKEVLRNLRFHRYQKSLPRRIVRRRGYKDKGSCVPYHRKLPKFDESLTKIQLQKDKKKYLQQKTIDRLLFALENDIDYC